MDFVKEGNHVLYLWEGEIDASLEKNVEALKGLTKVTVNVENVQRLALASYDNSTFDVIISLKNSNTNDLLALILKLLKPKGIAQISTSNLDNLKENLLLSGFVSINATNDSITCAKPNYEVGSSSKLSFAKNTIGEKSKVSAVWKIDNDDDEIIDADDLLEEEDKIKPDPSTLKVCGTTGKRKACKDCVCGLADELAAENGDVKTIGNPTEKSSCGSCYLGDAFRCASCPYLGMPAFKPGEKIQLSGNLLKADV